MLENIPNTKTYSLPLLVFYCCITNDHSYLHIGTTFNISHFLWIWHVLTESSAQGLIKAEIKVSIYLHPHMVVWLGKDPLPRSFKLLAEFPSLQPQDQGLHSGAVSLGWECGRRSCCQCERLPWGPSHMAPSIDSSQHSCLLISRTVRECFSNTIPSIKESTQLG